MSERRFTCPDGSEWRVVAAIRTSPYRMELVLAPVARPDAALRCEAEVAELSQLTDGELCFLVANR